MNWKEINWRTTGYGLGVFACYFVSKIWPDSATLCELVGALIVGAGFISAPDATRVKSIVQAVDALLWKNKMDPETLQVDPKIGT